MSYFYCGHKYTQKYGKVNGVQRYKCHLCGKQFLGGKRLDNNILWEEYTQGKQTYLQLAQKYDVSLKTIQRRIAKIEVKVTPPCPAICLILMDATYFGRNFGVILFKDFYSRKNILWKYVKYETLSAYISGINQMEFVLQTYLFPTQRVGELNHT